MAREIDSITNIGEMPDENEFQSVNQTLKGGKTGEPSQKQPNKYNDIADTVKGLFAEHSDKLLAVIALIGFTLVFYSGNLENWYDFYRYVAFLGVLLLFYGILAFAKWLTTKIDKE